MIELIIKEYLDKNIDVPVYLQEQESMPESFILFEKTSSGQRNKINTATFAFQSYGKSMYEAAELNDRLKIAIFNMVELDEIGAVKLNSDYNFTDTTTKRYRYQAVFNITY